jgi:hypothetical protein
MAEDLHNEISGQKVNLNSHKKRLDGTQSGCYTCQAALLRVAQ